jgi:hypothetical protein
VKKRFVLILLTFFICSVATAQNEAIESVDLKVKVISSSNSLPLEGVHVINLTKVVGTITDLAGQFSIEASLGDTLYLTYLGFKSEKIRVSNDLIRLKNNSITLTELAYALEEVVVRPYQLTGYLEIDVRNLPISSAFQYSISGLNFSYEGRSKSASKQLNAVLSGPVSFIKNVFSKKELQFEKLPNMKQDKQIRELLATKFDRETLSALLQIDKEEISRILNQCSYSSSFIQDANDLQILDAISQCYEEYKVLNR